MIETNLDRPHRGTHVPRSPSGVPRSPDACRSPGPTTSTVAVADSDGLTAIHEPAVNMCVWQRSLPETLAQFVDAVVLPRNIKRVLTCAADAPAIDELLQELPMERGFALLRADMLELAVRFAKLTSAQQLTLKLESFGSNLCERFHVDWVPLRLICSYAGPGTEWLDNAAADRAFLGPAAGDLADEASGLLRPGAVVQRMERFAVALMKGERWPGNQGNGVLHRSPRIAGSGQRRVLFKIDAGAPPASLASQGA